MRSQLFYTEAYKGIESRIMTTLNSHSNFLTGNTAGSPRAVGDAVEEILGEEFEAILVLGEKVEGDRFRQSW